MLVLLPPAVTKPIRRPYLAGAAGLALLCASLVGAAFTAVPSAARGATHAATGRADQPPLRDARATTTPAGFGVLMDSLARQVDELTSIPSILPTMGSVSSPFSMHRRHPIFHVTRPHEGIDIAAPRGMPVVAPAAGVVVAVSEQAGYGLLLELDHGGGVTTRYGHLARARVRAGQAVVRGQLIANVGSSGLATGPHLHYEIRVGGAVVDPLLFGP
jgi:murein DD-endopeptidase MepM/ murein hydrolase activator NlpD